MYSHNCRGRVWSTPELARDIFDHFFQYRDSVTHSRSYKNRYTNAISHRKLACYFDIFDYRNADSFRISELKYDFISNYVPNTVIVTFCDGDVHIDNHVIVVINVFSYINFHDDCVSDRNYYFHTYALIVDDAFFGSNAVSHCYEHNNNDVNTNIICITFS